MFFAPPFTGGRWSPVPLSTQQMLEEDAIRFDTFLKENDKKAHEAIKKAERETKVQTRCSPSRMMICLYSR